MAIEDCLRVPPNLVASHKELDPLRQSEIASGYPEPCCFALKARSAFLYTQTFCFAKSFVVQVLEKTPQSGVSSSTTTFILKQGWSFRYGALSNICFANILPCK